MTDIERVLSALFECFFSSVRLRPTACRREVSRPDRETNSQLSRSRCRYVTKKLLGNAADLADLRGQVAAIRRSQAVIEFNLDGTIIDANDNFLHAVGYELEEIRGRHHSIFVDA